MSHEKKFIAEVYLENQCLGRGSGKTKKAAEQKAAQKALKKISPKRGKWNVKNALWRRLFKYRENIN